jgi:sugar phosphate isomerase/epimerase
MKLNTAHLTYCTNIHAGEDWVDHFDALQKNFPQIKKQLSADEPMGIGLRLSNIASIDLQNGGKLDEFKKWLKENDAYVFTMNGFPYGGFHHTVVKDQVHTPDWTTDDRLNYTIRLFHILTQLLPVGMDGGISTSPLSYKPWFANAADRKTATVIATKNIIKVAEELQRIKQETGIVMHLDIEPEPDGFLESGREFIDWFEGDLLKAETTLSVTELKQHINLCYDVCHFAIGYEPHADIIKELAEKHIIVGKIQISAALKVLMPATEKRQEVINAISKYNEPTYLHQVIAKCSDGSLIRYPDLPEALADGANLSVTEWRAHFHIPIFEEDLGLIKSTQSDIIEVLDIQKNNPFTNHLEVETYTWEVLPDELKAPLDDSIVRELGWVLDRMKND